MDQNLQSFIESFYQITGELNKQRHKPISFDGTVPLNTAAIHLIDMIGKHPDYNATQLATVLGNTKGAISQMTAKLAQKGLIERQHSGANAKEVTYLLTPAGQRVYDGHARLHAQLYAQLEQIFADFSPAEIAKLKTALAAVEHCMVEYGHL